MTRRSSLLLWTVLLASLLGCPPPPKSAPEGTPTDPVTTCTEVGQVCKMGGSQLGVCTASESKCDADDACFSCMPQH